jgi:hypothetical protein
MGMDPEQHVVSLVRKVRKGIERNMNEITDTPDVHEHVVGFFVDESSS